jgi:hypothetical protein
MNSQVVHNLARVKELLPPSLDAPHNYRLFFNRVTGEMHFADRQPLSKAWRPAQLVIRSERHHTSFSLNEENGDLLSRTGVRVAAWKVACEMLGVLNTLGVIPEESLIKQPSLEEFKQWAGAIDRIEAERKLEHRPVGTYLIREGDPLAEEFARRLSEENNFLVNLYIVTYVAEEQKIVDTCILQTARGWTVYQDDPDLNKHYHFYPTTKQLLTHLPLRT